MPRPLSAGSAPPAGGAGSGHGAGPDTAGGARAPAAGRRFWPRSSPAWPPPPPGSARGPAGAAAALARAAGTIQQPQQLDPGGGRRRVLGSPAPGPRAAHQRHLVGQLAEDDFARQAGALHCFIQQPALDRLPRQAVLLAHLPQVWVASLGVYHPSTGPVACLQPGLAFFPPTRDRVAGGAARICPRRAPRVRGHP